MEFAIKNSAGKNSDLASSRSRKRNIIRMASPSRNTESYHGLGCEMKTFLVAVSMGLFMFCAFSSISIHTFIEVRKITRTMEILANYTPKQLGELRTGRI